MQFLWQTVHVIYLAYVFINVPACILFGIVSGSLALAMAGLGNATGERSLVFLDWPVGLLEVDLGLLPLLAPNELFLVLGIEAFVFLGVNVGVTKVHQ